MDLYGRIGPLSYELADMFEQAKLTSLQRYLVLRRFQRMVTETMTSAIELVSDEGPEEENVHDPGFFLCSDGAEAR